MVSHQSPTKKHSKSVVRSVIMGATYNTDRIIFELLNHNIAYKSSMCSEIWVPINDELNHLVYNNPNYHRMKSPWYDWAMSVNIVYYVIDIPLNEQGKQDIKSNYGALSSYRDSIEEFCLVIDFHEHGFTENELQEIKKFISEMNVSIHTIDSKKGQGLQELFKGDIPQKIQNKPEDIHLQNAQRQRRNTFIGLMVILTSAIVLTSVVIGVVIGSLLGSFVFPGLGTLFGALIGFGIGAGVGALLVGSAGLYLKFSAKSEPKSLSAEGNTISQNICSTKKAPEINNKSTRPHTAQGFDLFRKNSVKTPTEQAEQAEEVPSPTLVVK